MTTHIYGRRPDKQDLRDFPCHLTMAPANTLPKVVDLRPLLPKTRKDQGQLGSCTGNAGANHREFLLTAIEKKPYLDLSRLFIYYEERALEGTVSQDAGADMRDCVKVLNQFGACPEAEMPYDITKFTQAPTQKELADATQYRVKSYHRLASVEEMQQVLAQGSTFIIGITVWESFESYKTTHTGKVSLPRRGERVLGGHAMHVVGYQKIGRGLYFIVENSWGDAWGDHGFCYIPASYFKRHEFDAWVAVV